MRLHARKDARRLCVCAEHRSGEGDGYAVSCDAAGVRARRRHGEHKGAEQGRHGAGADAVGGGDHAEQRVPEPSRAGEQTAFLDLSFGKSDLWQNLRVVVANGSVREILEGWLSESDPSLRKIKTAVGDLSIQAGLCADIGFSAYREAVQGKYGDAILAYAGVNAYELKPDLLGDGAYPYTGGALLIDSLLKTSTAGSAVFDGDRMVGVLDGQHTMAVLMVIDAFQRGELVLSLPDGQPLAVTLYRMRRPKIRMRNGKATVDVFLEADPIEPLTVPADSESLRTWIETQVEVELQSVFRALQSVNSDAMGFGRFASRAFHSIEEWEAYDWKADYRRLSVAFSATVMLSHDPNDPSSE